MRIFVSLDEFGAPFSPPPPPLPPPAAVPPKPGLGLTRPLPTVTPALGVGGGEEEGLSSEDGGGGSWGQ